MIEPHFSGKLVFSRVWQMTSFAVVVALAIGVVIGVAVQSLI